MVEGVSERVSKAVTEIARGGLLRLFGAESDDGLTKGFKGWLNKGKARAADVVTESVVKALEDEEIKEAGSEYIRLTVSEGIDGIRKNFSSTLEGVNGAIRRSSEDTRDNYQIMKDLVGAEKGPWYSRLAKRAVARVFTWTAPVVSYVSAKVASEISSKKGKKDTKKYRNQFGELFTNLLVKLSPKQETQAAAA